MLPFNVTFTSLTFIKPNKANINVIPYKTLNRNEI